MPRALDPGILKVGSGLAANESIEASALIHPTASNEGLRVHIADPSRAHEARAITVEDTLGLFVADHVEGVLTELAGGSAAYSNNGLISGGTYTEAGGILTLDPTIILISGNAVDYSGASVALLGSTNQWVYVDSGTGLLSVSAGAPSYAAEHIPIVNGTTGPGMFFLTATDARYFVRNVDRKMEYTVRASGSDVNKNSEANFETIEAALLWIATYDVGGLSERTIITVRGNEVVSSTLLVPRPNIVFQGEGGASFTTGGGGVLFDLNGMDNTQFHDLTFICEFVGCTAIQDFTGGAATDLLVQKCNFMGGAEFWDAGIKLSSGGASARTTVRDTYIQAVLSGYQNDRPLDDRLENVTVESNGGGGTGIQIGSPPIFAAEGRAVIQNCRILDGFGTGIFLEGVYCTVRGCHINADQIGVRLADGGFNTVDGTTITLSVTTGEFGIWADDGVGYKITNNTIINLRTTGYGALLPYGIWLQGPDKCFLSNNDIEGFDSTTSVGTGIRIQGCNATTITGGYIREPGVGIWVDSTSQGVQASSINIHECDIPLRIEGTNCTFTGIYGGVDATDGLSGAIVSGSHNRLIGCTFTNTVAYGAGPLPIGIVTGGSDSADIDITDCTVTGFYNSTDETGIGIQVGLRSDRVNIRGATIQRSQVGVLTVAQAAGTLNARNIKISGVNITEVVQGLVLYGEYHTVTDCDVVLSGSGLLGLEAVILGDAVPSVNTGIHSFFNNCRFRCTRTWVAQVANPVGLITRAETGVKITNCLFVGFNNDGASPDGVGLILEDGGQAIIEGCTFEDCFQGIRQLGSFYVNWTVADCEFNGMASRSIILAACSRFKIVNNRFQNGAAAGLPVINVPNGAEDFDICGNYINGASLAGNGIEVTGTDGGGTRTSRFAINDNTIKECTGDSINLNGYVHDGTVSGNMVDNFLPADPYVPTGHGIRLVSDASGDVANITIDGNTVRRGTEGISCVGDNSGARVRGITVSNNTIDFCANGAAGASYDGAGSKGIGFEQGRALTIVGNTISNIGQVVTDTGAGSEGFPAADVSSVGIYGRNCSRVTCVGNTVSNTLSDGTGANSGIYFTQRDTGQAVGVKFTTRQFKIADNTLFWGQGLPGNGSGSIGITVTVTVADTDDVGSDHELFEVSITDNEIMRTRLSAIEVSSGDRSVMRQVDITGNVIRAPDDHGILLRQFDNGLATGNAGIQQVGIHNNNVRDAVGPGINVSADNGSTNVMTDVLVTGNKLANCGMGILMESSSNGTTYTRVRALDNQIISPVSFGFQVRSPSGTEFSHIEISRNEITDSGDEGIFLDSASVPISHLTLNHNHVAAPNTVAISLNVGIIGLSNANLSYLTVLGNRVFSGPLQGAMVVTQSGILSNVKVSDNTFQCGGTTSGYGLRLQGAYAGSPAADSYHQEISISDNTFEDGGIGLGLWFSGDPAVGVGFEGPKLRNVLVTNNIFRSHSDTGLDFQLRGADDGTGPGLLNLKVDGNTFEDIENKGVSFVIGDAAGGVDPIANISVDNNQFHNCQRAVGGVGVNSVIYWQTNAQVRNLSISDNQFNDCGEEEEDAEAILYVALGNSSLTEEDAGIVLDRNSFTQCTGVGIHIEDFASAASADFRTMSVSNNSFWGLSNTAIYLNFTSFSGLRNLSVDNNRMEDVIGGGGNDRGIWIRGMSSGTTTNVSVCGNNIRNTGLDGITLDLPDQADNIRVSNNSVWGAAQAGIELLLEAADSVQVCNNVIDRPLGTRGIFVEATGSANNIHISDNAILGHGIVADFSSTLDNISVCGNTLESPPGDGIQVATSTSQITGVIINDNTVKSPGDAGIRYDGSSGDTISMAINGNALYSCDDSGIYLESSSGALENVSIVGNTIRNFNTDGNTSPTAENVRSGIVFSSTTGHFRQCSVVGNNLRGNTDGCIGITFSQVSTTQDMWGISIVGNNYRSDLANVSTVGLHVETPAVGGSTDQRQWSVIGNNFRGQRLTGSNGGGSAAVDAATVRNNTATQSNGANYVAGGWAAAIVDIFPGLLVNGSPNEDS